MGALNVWGMRHAIRPPLPGEAIHPARLARSFANYLNTTAEFPPAPLGWSLVFDGERQDLWFDGDSWSRQLVESPALLVNTTVARWVAMLSQGAERPDIDESFTVEGADAERARLMAVMEGILSPS